MAGQWLGSRLTDADLEFIARAGAPHRPDPEKVVRLLRENPDFADPLLEKEEVFQAVMGQRERLLHLSPFLLFYILLLRVREDLRRHPHTFDLTDRDPLPLFDGAAVAKLLNDEPTRVYLAEMLASFVRGRQFTIFQEKDGRVTARVLNDMRVDHLIELIQAVPQENRYPLYRRLGDLCLLLTSFFAGTTSPPGQIPLTSVGQESYRQAAKMAAARHTGYEYVLSGLADKFELARKPLHLVRHHYLAGVYQ